jgi:hypothetical protein
MQPLTFAEILSVWERGWNRPPVDRALLLLRAAHPDRTLADLEKLSIGQRDRALVRLREETFGERFVCRSECNRCGEELEFQLDGLAGRFESPAASDELQTNVEDFEVRYRVLNSQDLKAALNCSSSQQATRLLLLRCILGAQRHGSEESIEDLPDPILGNIQELISEADPHADTRIEISCPKCGNRWLSPFDIVSYFWSELEAQAKRQLWEVHTLAGAYGWREVDIVEMNPLRRRLYLEMALA